MKTSNGGSFTKRLITSPFKHHREPTSIIITVTTPLQEIDANVTFYACTDQGTGQTDEKGLAKRKESIHSDQVPALESLRCNFYSNETRELERTAALSAVQKHPHDKDIQSRGMEWLWKALQDDLGWVTFEATKALIESTVAAITRFYFDKEVVSNAMKILNVLSHIDSAGVKRNLGRANVIESALDAMNHYGSDQEIVFCAWATIASLSENEIKIGADIVVQKLDVVSFLVGVMKGSRGNHGIVTMGFHLFKGLVEIKEIREILIFVKGLAGIKEFRGRLVESGAIRGLAVVFEKSTFSDVMRREVREMISTLMDY